MRKAITWRQSIYENDYVCVCGKKLRMADGNLADDLLFDTETNEVICPVCRLNVAIISNLEDVDPDAVRIEQA